MPGSPEGKAPTNGFTRRVNVRFALNQATASIVTGRIEGANPSEPEISATTFG